MFIYPPISEPTTSVASPVTSSIVESIPVPTYGTAGKFSIICKTRVQAPPVVVLSLVRNTNTWSKWNTFCPACEISSKSPPAPPSMDPSLPSGNEKWLDLGTLATVDVFMNGDGLVDGRKRSRTQGICITLLERIDEEEKTGYRIAWKGTGWSSWQLHSERVMEFVECEMNGGFIGTEYVCWETYGGMLSLVVKTTLGNQLVERFGDYARDIREYFLHRRKC